MAKTSIVKVVLLVLSVMATACQIIADADQYDQE